MGRGLEPRRKRCSAQTGGLKNKILKVVGTRRSMESPKEIKEGTGTVRQRCAKWEVQVFPSPALPFFPPFWGEKIGEMLMEHLIKTARSILPGGLFLNCQFVSYKRQSRSLYRYTS